MTTSAANTEIEQRPAPSRLSPISTLGAGGQVAPGGRRGRTARRRSSGGQVVHRLATDRLGAEVRRAPCRDLGAGAGSPVGAGPATLAALDVVADFAGGHRGLEPG